MKRAWIALMLGTGSLAAQELPPGLPSEIVRPKAPAPVAAPAPAAVPSPAPVVPAPVSPTPEVPASTVRRDEVAVPERIPVDHYQTLWQRSPFELSIQAANAVPTGIAADWLLTSVSRVDGQPMAILFNKTSGETAVVKTKDNGTHGMRLVSAEIMSDYRKSKVKVVRGSEQAELVFQEQDLTALAALAPVGTAAPPVPVIQNGIVTPRPTGSTVVQPGTSTSTSTSTIRPPRRIISRPNPVRPPTTP